MDLNKIFVEAIFENKATGPEEFRVVESVIEISKIDLRSTDVTGIPGYTQKLRVDVTMTDGTKYENGKQISKFTT